MNGGGVRVPPLPVDEDDWVRASERLRPQWQSIVAQHRQSEQAWKDPAFLLLRKFGIVLRVLVVSTYGPEFNLFLHSVDGVIPVRYRNLIERALKARLVYDSPNMNRAVSFVNMNRQLVWNEFSEMLLLLLPLHNTSSLKNFLRPFSKDKDNSGGDESICPICQSNPSIPFLALPCRLGYCYYCLRTRWAATSSCRCPGCNEPVVAMQRHSVFIDSINSNK